MRSDIRRRLERALERGELTSGGSGLSDRMRRRLDRALAGTGHTDGLSDPPGQDDTAAGGGYIAQDGGPVPRVYAADRLVGGTSREDLVRLPGEEITTPHGPVMCRRWQVPLEEIASLRDLQEARAGSRVLSALLEAPELECLRPERALYLDTETTGLAGGTGTYVFLLGLGWVEEERFVVEQLFLRDFSEEPAMLHRARELAGDSSTLVSFNGRRYDVPLLDTRLVMNRFPGELKEHPHLDLLQPARLLYSGRFEDCRLQTLEKELLGQVRDDDVPGAEIPALYFEYLAGTDPRRLLPVFEHNFLDVVTLLALTAHFLHLCQRPGMDPRALGGLGRLHGRRGDREQARELLEEARERRAATYRDLRELGFLYKRNDEYEKAMEVWDGLITRQEKYIRELGFDVTPFEEAAKHLEHNVGDFRRALEFTVAAMEKAARWANGQSEKMLDRLNHRAERLRRRLNIDPDAN
ncbi:MAG: ribonuclease H-like domain-containing protein [bacterium]